MRVRDFLSPLFFLGVDYPELLLRCGVERRGYFQVGASCLALMERHVLAQGDLSFASSSLVLIGAEGDRCLLELMRHCWSFVVIVLDLEWLLSGYWLCE